MTPHNTYLRYKQDTKEFLEWLLKASNAIISATPETEHDLKVNTTGQITVSGMVALSDLISKHIGKVPARIYVLLRSAIDARNATYESFKAMTAKIQDEEIERSNLAHKHFVDTLSRIFTILGGDQWSSSTVNAGIDDSDDMDPAVFANTFASLRLNGRDVSGSKDDDASSNNEEDNGGPTRQQHQQQRRRGKGKKRKNGRSSKQSRDQGQAAAALVDPLAEVPIESYRIIDDDEGLVTEYFIAVHSFVKDWIELRLEMQNTWCDVAYKGLNSAVAGVMSNVAIASIKRAEAAIFVDFPGHDSYATIMNTITRGNREKAQTNYQLSLHSFHPITKQLTLEKARNLDLAEQFSMHCYDHLLEFVLDFQKNRTGKPTKKMASELGDWQPELNLQSASHEDRGKWRRAYTINWLFDLVNLFSSIVVQRNNLKGEKHIFEQVDWSPDGPWNEHRRLYGLNDFAGAVTSLSMQKPSSDVRARIRPSLVFELQCIVDSFTVSRGWSTHPLHDNKFVPRPRNFRPRRDADIFLDREGKNPLSGFLQCWDVVKQLLKKDEMMMGDPARHEATIGLIDVFHEDFINWLGETKYMNGLDTITPSRFSNTNSNGLWEYSPFLCGIGLAEALDLTYRISMMMWDRLVEPILIVHLHNMLVEKQYIKDAVGLYGSLAELLPGSFFARGKAPKSDFGSALKERVLARESGFIGGMLHSLGKSTLLLFREADWDSDRIPDELIDFRTLTANLRLIGLRPVKDPASGELKIPDTPLMVRSRANGMSDEAVLAMAADATKAQRADPDLSAMMEQVGRLQGLGAPRMTAGAVKMEKRQQDSPQGQGKDMTMAAVKVDLNTDVCGMMPLSGINYMAVTIQIMLLFDRIEDAIREARHPLWSQIYESNGPGSNDKRIGLGMAALYGQDEELLRIMARGFQSPRIGIIDLTYWRDYVKTETILDPGAAANEPQCVLM